MVNTPDAANINGLFIHKYLYSLTHSLTYSRTHSLTYLLTYSLTHSLTYSLTQVRYGKHIMHYTKNQQNLWFQNYPLNKKIILRIF